MQSDVETPASPRPVPDFQVRDGFGPLHARVVAEIQAAIADLKGPGAVGRLGGDLGQLHQVIEVGDVGALRDRVIEALRPDLLALAVRIGRETLGWTHDFHVDDYLILRVNFPYEVARRATAPAENPGIGRVSPGVRAIAASRRVKDPVYDPQGYHRDHPPPAWAHGPHLDSWAGHSHDGVNIWWAISDVPPQAGMVLYPQMADTPLACDRRSLYLSAGHPLPPPTFAPLAAGEMLIFNPEVLHGTHLNVTDQTRVAVSLRLNAAQPTFDPASFYAREFWRRASDIEAGALDVVLHLKREEHFAPNAPPPVPPPSPRQDVRAWADGSALTIPLERPLREGERLSVDAGHRRVLLARTATGLHATDANCPHYGLDLMDGGLDGDRLHCPGCALGFDLGSGRSACGDLRLKTYRVREGEDGVRVEIATAGEV